MMREGSTNEVGDGVDESVLIDPIESLSDVSIFDGGREGVVARGGWCIVGSIGRTNGLISLIKFCLPIVPLK